MINIELLLSSGAVRMEIPKGKLLFQEGDKAIFYYQIIHGSIKMNNYNENGDETIQGIFGEGQSFGEPAILGHFEYPANAEAVEDSMLIKLEKNQFLSLLKKHPEISIELLATLSRRLRFKAILSKEVKSYDAEHRIMTLLELFNKNEERDITQPIDITRQTIANLTGLRVETVIRAIKKLEQQGRLSIRNRKIYWVE